MICPYCNQDAKWVSNEVVYGKPYGKSYMIWYCDECDAYVGCHHNTKNPKGTMANKELRHLRIKAHELFDPLWKEGKMTRKEAYKLLRTLGVNHIAETNIESCKKLILDLTTIVNRAMM